MNVREGACVSKGVCVCLSGVCVCVCVRSRGVRRSFEKDNSELRDKSRESEREG